MLPLTTSVYISCTSSNGEMKFVNIFAYFRGPREKFRNVCHHLHIMGPKCRNLALPIRRDKIVMSIENEQWKLFLRRIIISYNEICDRWEVIINISSRKGENVTPPRACIVSVANDVGIFEFLWQRDGLLHRKIVDYQQNLKIVGYSRTKATWNVDFFSTCIVL